MKGGHLIMTDTKVIYHSSYTDEENMTLHEFLEESTEKDLIEGIQKLVELSPEKERLEKAIAQLHCEISGRIIMKQKYDMLQECKNSWDKYSNCLYFYKLALHIRDKYKIYQTCNKNRYCHLNAEDFYYRCSDKESKEYDRKIASQSEDFVRRCTFSEESTNGIHKPVEPQTHYESLDSVPIVDYNVQQGLESLGKDNLKYLLVMLLQFSDSVGNENKADAILTFMTRKYAGRSHKGKKELPLFTSEIDTYEELERKCKTLLEDIRMLKEDSEIQRKAMNI